MLCFDVITLDVHLVRLKIWISMASVGLRSKPPASPTSWPTPQTWDSLYEGRPCGQARSGSCAQRRSDRL